MHKSHIHTFSKEDLSSILTLVDDEGCVGYNVEQGTIEFNGEVKLTMTEDIYLKKFFPNEKHENFLGIKKETEKSEEKEITVFSVLSHSSPYHILKTTKKGTEELTVTEAEVGKKFDVKKYLTSKMPTHKFWLTPTAFAHDFVELEKKHPQKKKQFKIAVIYCDNTQTTIKEMFSNKTTTPEFEAFLNVLGEKINLETWNGYRGDMGREGETYYRKWNEFDIIFHVSTLMDEEQHRRLIGNDVATIFFKEIGRLSMKDVDSLGTVPQVFAAVQPCLIDKRKKYRMSFFNRVNIKKFLPLVPHGHFWDEEEMREFLFTKIINGYATAFLNPPLNRLFFST